MGLDVKTIIKWAEQIEDEIEGSEFGYSITNKEAVIAHAILNAIEKHGGLKNE